MLLLLASRVTGLLRETVQAATLGISANADVVVLMLTLPDLLVNVLVLGGLSYVSLPLWAGQEAPERAASQQRMAQWCLGVGLALAMSIVLFRKTLVGALAPALEASAAQVAADGMLWVALLLPPTCLAALRYCRLQFERDFVGLYGWNLLVNGVLIAAFVMAAWLQQFFSFATVFGLALLLATGLRLAWQNWRLARLQLPPAPKAMPRAPPLHWPALQTWVWAALAAGLPLLLPLIARSQAAGSGEGALAAFNYAYKLVELPNSLAIQVVAALAFPAISRAVVQHMQELSDVGTPGAQASTLPDLRAVRTAYSFAWALACAGACALASQPGPIAGLLFGWGRMQAAEVQTLASWAAAGSWSLLPQALIAVTAVVMASTHLLRRVATGFALAVAILLLWGSASASHSGGQVAMWALTATLALLAAFLMLAAWPQIRRSLPWLEMLGVGAAAWSISACANWFVPTQNVWGVVIAATAAAGVLLVALGISGNIRAMLRRR